MKLVSVLHDVIWAGLEFQRDASAKKKLILIRSVLGLDGIVDRNRAPLL